MCSVILITEHISRHLTSVEHQYGEWRSALCSMAETPPLLEPGASCLAGAGGEVGVRGDELPIGAGVGLPGAVAVPPPLVVPRQAAPVRAVVAGEPQQHELPVLVGALRGGDDVGG